MKAQNELRLEVSNEESNLVVEARDGDYYRGVVKAAQGIKLDRVKKILSEKKYEIVQRTRNQINIEAGCIDIELFNQDALKIKELEAKVELLSTASKVKDEELWEKIKIMENSLH